MQYHSPDADSRTAIETWSVFIGSETLAAVFEFVYEPVGKEVTVGTLTIWLSVKKV